ANARLSYRFVDRSCLGGLRHDVRRRGRGERGLTGDLQRWRLSQLLRDVRRDRGGESGRGRGRQILPLERDEGGNLSKQGQQVTFQCGEKVKPDTDEHGSAGN